jgi:hypothetical protein
MKPYTYREKDNTFEIMFEGTVVRIVLRMLKQDIQEIVWLLNNAYTLGHIDGRNEKTKY